MDKLKNNGNPTPALVVKLILVLVFLLTAAFVSGVVIGKNGRGNIDRTSSDEEGINEKLSNCIFNSDELREKYLKLRDAAREKGLVDENDVVNAGVVCSVRKEGPAEGSEAAGEEAVETSEKGEDAENTEKTEAKKENKKEDKKEAAVEKKPEKETPEKEKNTGVAQQKDAEDQKKPDKKEKPAEKSKAEPGKHGENKTIDEILSEKSAAPKKDQDKKCLFSIQLFAGQSREEAVAAGKLYRSLKTRVVEGVSNDKKWYRLRTGCFSSREEADAALPKVKNVVQSAVVVAE